LRPNPSNGCGQGVSGAESTRFSLATLISANGFEGGWANAMKQVPKLLIEGPKALIEDAHSPPNLSTFGKTRSTLNHFS
jgi:hypothetical protein